jgi:hypothetical protein
LVMYNAAFGAYIARQRVAFRNTQFNPGPTVTTVFHYPRSIVGQGGAVCPVAKLPYGQGSIEE